MLALSDDWTRNQLSHPVLTYLEVLSHVSLVLSSFRASELPSWTLMVYLIRGLEIHDFYALLYQLLFEGFSCKD